MDWSPITILRPEGAPRPFLRYLAWRFTYKGLRDVCSALIRKFLPPSASKALPEIMRLIYKIRPPKYQVIQIETIAGCNYRCSFCPIGKIEMPLGRMSMHLFLKIIDELKDFRGAIHLYLRNEPLLDKRIVDLARIARERTKASIKISTNGALLTKDLAQDLSKYCTIIVNDYGNQVGERVREWADIKNMIVIPRGENVIMENRAGNLPDRPVVKLDAFCVRPFEQLYVAFDGRVVICCQDWKLEEVLGNVAEDTLNNIWNGSRYRKLRAQLLRRERTGLCAKCDFAGA